MGSCKDSLVMPHANTGLYLQQPTRSILSSMAVEKFIRGKRDECNHDGRYSNTKRLQQAISDLEVGEQLYVSLQVYRQRDRLPEPMVTYHQEILTAWGVLPEPEEKIIYGKPNK